MISITQALSTTVNILYEGKDITRDISPYLLGFSFTDNAGGKADDLNLTLQDKSGIWLRDWLPSKGDILTASIIKAGHQVMTLPCGKFSIDQIDYSTPPATFTIKAVSASVKGKAAVQRHTRTWQSVTLREVIADLAVKNGLKLFLDADVSSSIASLSQVEQSDLDFLKELCADYGLNVKVQEERLVIYDLAKYEEQSETLTISASDPRVISVKFTSKSAKVYRKARVKYHDALSDEDFESEYEDEDEEGSERELEICERVESESDAARLAKQRVLTSNRKEVTGSITLTGDVRLAAGLTVKCAGFGMFSGKHFINKATHKVDGSGYTTTLELGQPKSEKGKSKKLKKSRKSKAVHQQLFYEGEHYY